MNEKSNNNESEKVFATGFKGFDPDMKCRGKQYAENTVFEEEGGDICDSGVMHFCEHPLDVFRYYRPVDNRGRINIFAPVEALAESQKSLDKYATTKIRIGAKIDFSELAKAAVDFVLGRAKKEKIKSSTGYGSYAINVGDCSCARTDGDRSVAINCGEYSVASNFGNLGVATSTGTCSVAVNNGHESAAVNTGYLSAATNAGDYSFAANTGNHSVAINTGDLSAAISTRAHSVAGNYGNYSVATSIGDRSVAISTGNHSVAINNGWHSASSVSGKESIAIATGVRGKAKGALGCYIACAEWGEDDSHVWHLKKFKTAKVDGKKIKPDIFYMLKNGKFVEVKDEK